MSDSALNTFRTAKRVVGVKVLGVVPEVRRWRKVGSRLRKEGKKEGKAA